jgi:dsRNA-specific ribonuclease
MKSTSALLKRTSALLVAAAARVRARVGAQAAAEPAEAAAAQAVAAQAAEAAAAAHAADVLLVAPESRGDHFDSPSLKSLAKWRKACSEHVPLQEVLPIGSGGVRSARHIQMLAWRGDALLSYAVRTALIERFPAYATGKLGIADTAAVSNRNLAKQASRLVPGLNDESIIKYGGGGGVTQTNRRHGGKPRISLLAQKRAQGAAWHKGTLVEACIAVVYDAGELSAVAALGDYLALQSGLALSRGLKLHRTNANTDVRRAPCVVDAAGVGVLSSTPDPRDPAARDDHLAPTPWLDAGNAWLSVLPRRTRTKLEAKLAVLLLAVSREVDVYPGAVRVFTEAATRLLLLDSVDPNQARSTVGRARKAGVLALRRLRQPRGGVVQVELSLPMA